MPSEETVEIPPKVVNFCGKTWTLKKGKTITKKFETPARAKVNGAQVVIKKGVRTKTYDGLFCESKAAQHRRVQVREGPSPPRPLLCCAMGVTFVQWG